MSVWDMEEAAGPGAAIKIVFPGGQEVEKPTPLSLEDFLGAVREAGVKRFRAFFTPAGGEGKWLDKEDFPLAAGGIMLIMPVDKAA